ncbi:MAG: phosphoribosylformylglycinamidine synthase [Bacilli bacterium]
MNKYRIFVEKKEGFQIEAKALANEFNSNLNQKIRNVRFINIYDVFNISKELLEKAKSLVFADKVQDVIYDDIKDLKIGNNQFFAIEFLPGQFDQRADSTKQLIAFIDPKAEVFVKTGKLIVLEGEVDLEKVKGYYINKIETREKDLNVLNYSDNDLPKPVGFVEDFFDLSSKELVDKFQLAMSVKDMDMIKEHYTSEARKPTVTEIKMLDTYWSDHCRHTTFETELDIEIKDKRIKQAFEKYLSMRNVLKREAKPVTLMDMAKINMLYEKNQNNLKDLEISEETNACSIYIDVDVDGKIEKWLLMFKNETHNHPTEVEPFGGASTCVGGAIRDPLSGRSYVYQALRVTGAADITKPISETLEGKLPQRVISKKAALGYSSYGNQIGLPASYIKEIFHEGYLAKRMELGAVIAACPVENVIRKTPQEGDVVILLGGRTGRDGIGGATSSSKQHTDTSLEQSAAEVQKGNAPEERKIQRLFRKAEVTTLIKKANDFGAGGVSVAIGELADGLEIYLDKVPVKYKGLNETELAISESQERMAVVVSKKDVEKFIKLSSEENLEATVVAKVTSNNRLIMKYNDKVVVNLSRDFINTNGARQNAKVVIAEANYAELAKTCKTTNLKEDIVTNLSDLNVCSQKGLIEMFDSTIGASTVLMPYGGKYQETPTQGSVGLIPVLEGNTKTCSIMTVGYNPVLSSISPYHGAKYAIVESMAKLVAMGGEYEKVRFTFQEYFEKLGKDSSKWAKPTASLLGAVEILNEFNLASIGGKDSMSGTFNDLNVPPALISFAVTTANSDNIVSPELKSSGNYLYLVKANYDKDYLPNASLLKKNFKLVEKLIKEKTIVSSYALEFGGLSAALIKMSLGNKLGLDVSTKENLFDITYGNIVIESTKELTLDNFIKLGKVTDGTIIINGCTLTHEEALKALKAPLEKIYPEYGRSVNSNLSISKDCYDKVSPKFNKTKVNVLIPVFPGSNNEYDIYKAFLEEKANPKMLVFKNLTFKDISNSIIELKEAIDKTDILVIGGALPAGDGSDGSGKYLACILNNQEIKEAIEKLIARKGLILGISSGFQALVKAGLLPYGDFKTKESSPTLVKNEINRYVSKFVKTRVTSLKSPWLSSFEVGEVHEVAISQGEGGFVVDLEMAKNLFDNGQVAFQYCDFEGKVTNDPKYNPNGSLYAIEGIISKDGLILGKMGHSERKDENAFKNIYGNKVQNIFANAVNYFKGI